MPVLIVIICMSIVTLVPRILPAIIIDRVKFPIWVGQWLEMIPYAALGALIFPGILNVIPDQPQIGFFGGLIAIVLALFRFHIIFVVLGATAFVYLLL
ncbi:AzlD domain-containing protein [Amphibacillus sp. MSJ-3]|uniref:AzlD domain-containing protein n=1 Tax=Amphibacillus sp. MSJ-3 TaxID=2841505 RepID=UPI001C0EA0BB|nr:AzlD domain-containing protein [Amphibacillus sp. MSJ-3]MBU5595364.1 AzlD domain-containing protein [Amphibacillus sp. MSJ-3]